MPPNAANAAALRWQRWTAGAVVFALAACTLPIRQFDLKNQMLPCEQANAYTYRTLQAMGFTVTAFEPATVGRPGTLRGTREDRGTQNVTVVVTCHGSGADIEASEDGKILSLLEFKRGFYMSFTATAAQSAVTAAAAREEAARPLEHKREKGLQVLLEPVRGVGSMLDFDLDLSAAGVLPVQVTIKNATARTYTFDPGDVVLIQKDGARVHPLPVADAAQRVADAGRQKDEPASPDAADVRRRLEGRLLTGDSVSANQSVKGYLFFPLGPYVKGRMVMVDKESDETEGFVVEF